MNKASVFQHRHYKAIAALIATTTKHPGNTSQARVGMETLANAFSNMFEQDNPRFDRTRFLAAANGKPSNGRDKVRS